MDLVYLLARSGVWRGVGGAGVLRFYFMRQNGSPALNDGGAVGDFISVRIAVVRGAWRTGSV